MGWRETAFLIDLITSYSFFSTYEKRRIGIVYYIKLHTANDVINSLALNF